MNIPHNRKIQNNGIFDFVNLFIYPTIKYSQRVNQSMLFLIKPMLTIQGWDTQTPKGT